MKVAYALRSLSVVALFLALAGLSGSALRWIRWEVPSERGVQGAAKSSDSPARIRLQQSYAQLPLSFEPNLGQLDGRGRFVAHGSGGNVLLTSTGAVFSLHAIRPPAERIRRGIPSPSADAEPSAPSASFRMRLVGANSAVELVGLDKLPGRANYFIGNEPSKWRTNIPTFRKVKCAGIYAGVDLVYYGNGRQLEYDFIVSPGADPGVIRVAFDSVDSMQVNEKDELVLRVSGREVMLRRPVVYQEVSGQKKAIGGGYVLAAHGEVAFRLEAYDRSRALVIDPVLAYSTYLGGSAPDVGYGIALDGSGSVYVTGSTFSTNFPTVNPLQAANGGTWDAFVAKLNASGSALIYSTYLGGSGVEAGFGIAVDGAGNAYVAGRTSSTNFPTANPLQAANGGGVDAFVFKLNAAGSALVYSTYLGGLANDVGSGIAVDGAGNAYVTGSTESPNFPTANPLQPANGGNNDVFVAKLNTAGSVLVYSTYLGGNSNDAGIAIAVDGAGNAYVTGLTDSRNFPTSSALQATAGGLYDVFVAKLNTAGSVLVYSTYLGGNSNEAGTAIAVDGSGNAYVTGLTESTNFPTTSPLQPANAGLHDAFVTKLNAAGSALLYSTYVGGSGNDFGASIALDGAGNAYVTGSTESPNFPTANPLQPANGGSSDVFVVKLNPVGSTLVYATYLGGSGDDSGNGIAVDHSGNAYVAGSTNSTNFPLFSAMQSASGGADDAIVAKITTWPLVSSIDPAVGSTAGATSVTLSGANFAPGATIALGGVLATNVTFISTAQLNAQTGSHSAGKVDVLVTNPDGESAMLANGFTYVSSPPSGSGCHCQANVAGPSLWIGLAILLHSVWRRKSRISRTSR